jgi:SAM-dependent methyltransferase
MPSDARRQHWQQRYLALGRGEPQPARVLADNSFLLPPQGRALDLACGRGGNALFLARRGFATQAWDYAPAAIESLSRIAVREALPLQGVVRDVVQDPPPVDSFDVIVVSFFLQRDIMADLIAALHQGGLIFYETFVQDAVAPSGPDNPAYRLADNELLRLFAGQRILSYQEHGSVGDPAHGQRNVARLVAQKPRGG